jgi:hypothetical protein
MGVVVFIDASEVTIVDANAVLQENMYAAVTVIFSG